MGVFLRHAETRLFFVRRDQWVSERGQARAFQRIEDAVAAVQAEDLDNVEVLVKHGEPACELALPIRRELLRRN